MKRSNDNSPSQNHKREIWRAAAARQRQKPTEDLERFRRWHQNAHLKRHYSLTLQDYEKLLVEQKGVCALCFQPPVGKKLGVDHDHITGKIRGLLCGSCNLLLTGVDNIEWLERAVDYIRRFLP